MKPTRHEPGPLTRESLALAAGFTVLLALLVSLGAYSAITLKQARRAAMDSTQRYLARREALGSVRSSLYTVNSHLRDFLVDPDESNIAEHRDAVQRTWKAVQDFAHRYQAEHLAAKISAYGELVEQALALSEPQRIQSGYTFLTDQLVPARDALLEAIEAAAQRDQAALRTTISTTSAQLDLLQNRLLIVVVLSVVTGLFVAWLTSRRLIQLAREATTRQKQAQESADQLEQLSHRLLTVQESERKALARELHDEVGQSLTALLVDLGQARQCLQAAEPAEAATLLQTAVGLGERTLRSVRDTSLLLRPSMLDDLGLIPALHWQAREVSRRSGIRVQVQTDDEELALPEEYRTTVFRIVQEALQNAERHSGASSVDVCITQSHGRVHILISDDGHGFVPERSLGMGLLGVQERASHLGGQMRISSSANDGTSLAIDLPAPPVSKGAS